MLSTLVRDLWEGAFPVSLFKVFQGLNSAREVVYFGNFLVETRFACCLNFVQLPTGHTGQHVFAIVRGLIPVQLHELLPVLLLQSWKSRIVATLGPFPSTRQSLEGWTRRSAASCILDSSLLLSALNAPDRRSPLPSTSTFSNSGRSSFRTDLDCNSLECFVSRLMSRRHSLQLNDSLSNSHGR